MGGRTGQEYEPSDHGGHAAGGKVSLVPRQRVLQVGCGALMGKASALIALLSLSLALQGRGARDLASLGLTG